MSEDRIASNRGFLREEFRLYHLRDNKAQEFEFHYHDFDKIVIFLSGKVSYLVEGKTYRLAPWDILFVRHNSIHKPVIDPAEMYERVVLWMNKGFLDEHSLSGDDLSSCFDLAERSGNCLLRLLADECGRVGRHVDSLEGAVRSQEFGSELATRMEFLRLMVYFNRLMLHRPQRQESDAYVTDAKVDEILKYINAHLCEDLSVELLSRRFYASRFHFMRRFKEATGYTVHSYILQKRLAAAAEAITNGASASEAAAGVGFAEYSSFLRSFKRVYDMTPRQMADRKKDLPLWQDHAAKGE